MMTNKSQKTPYTIVILFSIMSQQCYGHITICWTTTVNIMSVFAAISSQWNPWSGFKCEREEQTWILKYGFLFGNPDNMGGKASVLLLVATCSIHSNWLINADPLWFSLGSLYLYIPWLNCGMRKSHQIKEIRDYSLLSCCGCISIL